MTDGYWIRLHMLLGPYERRALAALTTGDGENRSSVIRSLIRREAARRGVTNASQAEPCPTCRGRGVVEPTTPKV